MKRLLILASTSLLLTACQGKAPTANEAVVNESAAVDTGADEAAIRGQVDRWGQLIKAKDAAGIAGLYTADGVLMPPNTPLSRGAGLQKTWASLMQIPGFDLAIKPEQITVSASGDMAFDRGTYRLTMTPDGKAQTDTGKYVVVWRKEDGTWKAAADIFNSDLPTSGG